MKYRELGKSGIKLSGIGLGCMGMSAAYGTPDNDESIVLWINVRLTHLICSYLKN